MNPILIRSLNNYLDKLKLPKMEKSFTYQIFYEDQKLLGFYPLHRYFSQKSLKLIEKDKNDLGIYTMIIYIL